MLDEAHHAPKKTVKSILGFSNENARFLLLSTPPIGVSHVTDIIEGRLPDGTPICEMTRLDYNCDACRIIQVDMPTHRCLHKEYLRLRKTPGSSIAAGYAAYGKDTDGAMREIDGSSRICRNLFIEPDRLKHLKEANRHLLESFIEPEYLFISMDPAGAARQRTDIEAKRSHSDYAVVTGFMTRGTMQVIFFLFFLFIYLSLLSVRVGGPNSSHCCTAWTTKKTVD